MRLYLVRHCKTPMNEKHLIQGSRDISLSDLGIKEAYIAKEKLKNMPIDICFSSPLKRTLETANIIVGNKCKIIIDNRLIERILGEFEGKPHDEYAKGNYWDYNLNNTDKGVEGVRQLLDRSRDFLLYIKNLDYDNVLIVTHAAILRAMHFNIVGYDEDTKFLEFYPENGVIYEYIL